MFDEDDCYALSDYSDEDISEEYLNRKLDRTYNEVVLDDIDNNWLDVIIKTFCNANWAGRARIITAIKDLGL